MSDMSISTRDVIVYVVLGAMFFAVPILVEWGAERRRIRLVGQELVALALPPMACVAIYESNLEMMAFTLSAAIGLFLGFGYAHTMFPKGLAMVTLLMGLASAAISAVVTVVLIASR